jgi:hypothetical protein
MIHRIDPIQFTLLFVILVAIGLLGIVSQDIEEAGSRASSKLTIVGSTCNTPRPLAAQSFAERSQKEFFPPVCW